MCMCVACTYAKVVICVGTEKVDGTVYHCHWMTERMELYVTWKTKQINRKKQQYFSVTNKYLYERVCVCVCTSWSKRAYHFRHFRILINSFVVRIGNKKHAITITVISINSIHLVCGRFGMINWSSSIRLSKQHPAYYHWITSRIMDIFV